MRTEVGLDSKQCTKQKIPRAYLVCFYQFLFYYGAPFGASKAGHMESGHLAIM
jgi:hypothetical protein